MDGSVHASSVITNILCNTNKIDIKQTPYKSGS